MTATLAPASPTEIFYPSADGKPVAETYLHFYAILITLEVLRQYLRGRQATVLGNQFLYYAQGFPKLRVAPDVMVIFDVEPGGRDNYQIWQEKQVPKVIFEMTSKSTKHEDLVKKKQLYEGIGVEEYWLFDPKGEWIKSYLRGYRLQADGAYQIIQDSCSQPLQLRLEVEGALLAFYRQDTGEKLLMPEELADALVAEKTAKEAERVAREKAEQGREKAEQENDRLKQHLRSLGVDPDRLEQT